MEPITREELFWAKVIGETVPDIEPVVRKEMFLARIAGMDIPAIEPITREEMFLNAIANKKTIDLEPITRREMFLAKAMGADVATPEPFSRIEFFLSQVKSNESGGLPEEPESNAIFTADFEDGTLNGFSSVSTVAVSPDAAYNSNYGLLLTSDGNYTGSYQMVRGFEIGSTYAVRVMFKNEPSAVATIVVKSGDWMTELAMFTLEDADDWTEATFELTATGTACVFFLQSVGNKGTKTYIDDIVVTEI